AGRGSRAAVGTLAVRNRLMVSDLVSYTYGDDTEAGRRADPSTARTRRTRGCVDAGCSRSGRRRVHRAAQPPRSHRQGARRRVASICRSVAAARRMIYLNLEELLHIASRTLGEYKVRDYGLLNAALARPQTYVFGYDAYPTLAEKAAALLY